MPTIKVKKNPRREDWLVLPWELIETMDDGETVTIGRIANKEDADRIAVLLNIDAENHLR